MFMDPSAFEADDIERELRDAGLEPEAQPTTTSREGERHEDPLLNPGKRNDASPSCGSSYGLSSAGVPDGRNMSGGGGDGGGNRGWEEPKKHGEPRALTENLDSGSRQRQSAPTFGRHSIGGGGKGEPRSGAQRRSQNSPPPPSTTPPLGSASPLLSGGGGSYGFRNEVKSQEDSTESVVTTGGSTASSATGVRSRARVLAQQREIQQRKKRQQALSSGGIRASDAASLSRGLVSGGPGIASRRSSADEVGVGPGEGEMHLVNGLLRGFQPSLLDGNRDDDQDETSNAFSPSVKQFSAPRQVEGDAYTAFNANSPRPHAGGANLSSMSSEFERRRSITQHGLGGDSDDTDEDQDLGSSGGPRRRRNKNKAAPDMGNRYVSADGGGSPKGSTPDEQSNGGHKTGHPRGEESRRSKSRPDDWDDRNRPSTKTYKWGRERDVGSKSPPRQNPPTGSGGRDREAGRVRRDQHHQPRSNRTKKHDFDGGGDRSLGGSEEERGTPDENSESSRSYIGSSGSSSESSRNEKSSRTGRRSSDPRLDSRRKKGGGGRRGSPPRSRPHGDKERGGGGRSNPKAKGSAAASAGGGSSSRRRERSGTPSSSPLPGGAHDDRGRRSRGRRDDSPGSPGRSGRRRGPPTSSRVGAHAGFQHRRSPSGCGDGPGKSNGRADSGQARGEEGRACGRLNAGCWRGSSRNRRDGNTGRSEAVYDEGERSAHRSKGPGEEKRMEDQEEAKNSPRPRGDGVSAAAPSGALAGAGTSAGAGPRASASGGDVEFNMAAIDLSDMKRFLLSPCPRAAGVVQCYIRRNKTRSNKLFPEYSLFMKEGDRFLMCSKKRPNNATSNYLISMRAGDLDRNSTNFLGKLRANFVGTEFQVYDNGYNPKEQPGTFGGSWGTGNHSGGGRGSGVGNEPMREELGCIMYASNVLGSRGPRKMQASVAIPTVTETGVVSKWSELDGGRGSQTGGGGSKAIDRVKNRDYDGSIYMVNKPPRWNDQVGAYVLNFYGRVTMASVKNFQLVSTEDFDRIILQFGRVARDEFTMDFQQYPITPFQAFAITLSSFDSKIACD
ncbi:unnamed protein product [Scytosiphon promiscuus]